MMKLRPYQQTGVESIRQRYIEKDSAPLFVLPTGGGKTVIFTHIAGVASKGGKRVWILVHRVELLRQTANALRVAGIHCGMIHSMYTPDILAPVQIASVQTLVRRFKNMDAPDLIIIDEAHHATAGSWRTIIENFPKARTLGVTATPIRGDGYGLGVEFGGVFDSIVIGPQKRELIEMGFLAPSIVYGPPVNRLDLSDVEIIDGDFDQKAIEKKVDKPVIIGDAVEHYMEICPGVPAVAFCASVAHAEHVAHEFRAAGFSAYSVDGSMDDDTRSRILAGLGNGTIDVVTSCDIISEGTDIPAIVCGILLRPTMSLALYIQQVGRPARISEGKKECFILDHVGNVARHGHPDIDRVWTLEGRKYEPGKKSGSSTRTVERVGKVQQCKNCGAIHEAMLECPHCGTLKGAKERQPKQRPGKLEIINPEPIENTKKKKK